jgi:hypothetical protein
LTQRAFVEALRRRDVRPGAAPRFFHIFCVQAAIAPLSFPPESGRRDRLPFQLEPNACAASSIARGLWARAIA